MGCNDYSNSQKNFSIQCHRCYSLESDFYSDIEDPNDLELPLFLPEPQPQFPPSIHNFGDVLRKTLDSNKFPKSGNIHTQMYFGDGVSMLPLIYKELNIGG